MKHAEEDGGPARGVTFPPGKSGGLIEAIRSLNKWNDNSGSFRRVNPAASLKRDAFVAVEAVDVPSFRRVNPAASLKRQPQARCTTRDRRVSAG